MDQKYITIQGARENNLKNISLKIPKDKLVIMTGVSGSGKTSDRKSTRLNSSHPK